MFSCCGPTQGAQREDLLMQGEYVEEVSGFVSASESQDFVHCQVDGMQTVANRFV